MAQAGASLRPGPTASAEIAPVFWSEICDFPRGPGRTASAAPLRDSVAQLDDVHSVLRLNHETPKDLISLALPMRRKTHRFRDGHTPNCRK